MDVAHWVGAAMIMVIAGIVIWKRHAPVAVVKHCYDEMFTNGGVLTDGLSEESSSSTEAICKNHTIMTKELKVAQAAHAFFLRVYPDLKLLIPECTDIMANRKLHRCTAIATIVASAGPILFPGADIHHIYQSWYTHMSMIYYNSMHAQPPPLVIAKFNSPLQAVIDAPWAKFIPE
jgi:hypothetical protein